MINILTLILIQFVYYVLRHCSKTHDSSSQTEETGCHMSDNPEVRLSFVCEKPVFAKETFRFYTFFPNIITIYFNGVLLLYNIIY
jgi:hypothetical protein